MVVGAEVGYPDGVMKQEELWPKKGREVFMFVQCFQKFLEEWSCRRSANFDDGVISWTVQGAPGRDGACTSCISQSGELRRWAGKRGT